MTGIINKSVKERDVHEALKLSTREIVIFMMIQNIFNESGLDIVSSLVLSAGG